MKKNIILILITTLFIVSCNKSKKQGTISSKIYNLKGTNIFKDKFNIYNTYFIDSLLLIRNMPDKNSSVFSLFKVDQDSYSHIYDFGKIGDGPSEFENEVYYTNQFYTLNGELKIWVYEMNKTKYSLINITKTLEREKVILDKEIRIKPGLSYQDLFYINENKIVGNSDNLSLKMKRLTFYNPILDTVSKSIKLNTKIKNLKKNDLNYTQQSYNPIFLNILRYNSKKEKLVSAMVSMDKIDIFNTDGDLEKSIFNKNNKIKEVKDYESNPKTFFADMVLTNDYIYTLYSGELTSDYYGKSLPTKIKVYDWNYDLKAVINIKESLNFISVDEENAKIVGVSITQEKTVEYSIKEFLNENI
mgnify:CR=1 FL=1